MEDTIHKFQQEVWDYYARHAREMPWRIVDKTNSIDPYCVLVSEIMLQQTQVARVIPKYESFMEAYPTVHDLAEASVGDVVRQWQGLGYNRRAKFLLEAAKKICSEFGGRVPLNEDELISLPGIGKNTAAAIRCYATNRPVTFIETNIRTVYIHHFFQDKDTVADKEILDLVKMTCDIENPRQWYWALMDYGTHLKAVHGNIARRSKSYTKQSSFNGSLRQIRGKVLKYLSQEGCSLETLEESVSDKRLRSVLQSLQQEGFIKEQNNWYELV